MAARVCSECGTSLAGANPAAKTCSSPCRSKRSRRLKRQSRDKVDAMNAAHAAQVHMDDVPAIGREVMKEELRPVVREMLTEDVLRSIQKLVALTPDAVDKIAEDLHSDDLVLRNKAYTLITRYTIGHQSLVPPTEMEAQGLTVNFHLPRPGDQPDSSDAVTGSAVELDADDEFRTCDMCGEEKPITEFIARSFRCSTCFEQQRERAAKLLHTGTPSE